MWSPPRPRIDLGPAHARLIRLPGVAVLACCACLMSCVTAPEKDGNYFKLEASPTLVSYQRVTIQLKDSSGNLQATLYDDSLPGLFRLEHLSAGPYQGGKAYITILAYKAGKLAYRETRFYDGETEEVISLEIVHDDPVAPVVPTTPVAPADPKPDTSGPVKHAPVLRSLPGDTLVTIRDSVPLPVEVGDVDGDLAAYSWDCDGDGRPEDSASLSGPFAKFRFVRAFADSGTRTCVVKIWDRQGLSVQGKVKIHVVLDPPSANAGEDTTVVAGTPILLHARGLDGMGPVVYMEWKIGSAEFARTPQMESTVKAPNMPGDLVCILRVHDSDSLTALDTLVVKVIYSPDNTLADLQANGGKLQPAFRKDVHDYVLALGPKDSVLVLAPQPNNAHAQAVIQAAGISPSSPQTVPVPFGDTIIIVQVTAQDGSTLQYSVTARR